MKILLVEDQRDSRRMMRRLIEQRGHEVVSVASAEEAEVALRGATFPFLILDWMLPGKSGVELCKEVRALPNGDEYFILLVTARADTDDLQQALAAGANDYLTKPLDLGLLSVRLSVAERQIKELAERNHARAALQESARQMGEMLENTNDAFFSVDHLWNFIYLNAEAETLLSRSRADLLGANLWERLPELLGTVFEESYRRVVADQVPVEFEASDKSGRTWVEVHAYPSGGGMSVFFRDVSERKRAETERLTTSKLESLGTLAGGIAHDLNNILTVISGNIGLAQLEASEGEKALLTHLGKAGAAAQTAANLSSQLLTFSKGGSPLKKVMSTTDLLRKAAEFPLHGSNVRAEIDIPSDLWKAEVDRAQIEQVVNALVLNAREAMPGGGTVRVAARNIEIHEEQASGLMPGRYVRVRVIDDGGGVREDVATKIFDPYFTTKATSSGLGLAISYSIVKKHGGVLQLEKSSPDGATFTFYLPAVERDREIAPPRPLTDGAGGLAQRILVMDDEEGVRDLTSALLGTLGYEVTAVPDGREALREYESAMRHGKNYQAVILDATIRGGMGGVATIERLRNMDPNVTAIICSGYSDEAALSEFLAFGFRGALPKPFTRRDLADVLQRAFAASLRS